MDTYTAIMTRRTIRSYTQENIDDKIIEDILKAAMQAPTAHNRQPWEFIVISDKKILEEIATFHPHAQMAKSAPLAILVCGNTQLETRLAFLNQDCAAAIQNILLTIHDKGLGGVWSGIYDKEDIMQEFQKICKLPSHIIPMSIVVLGYPAEKKEKENRFNPKKIHKNHW
jgi:nitroreductase